MPGLKQWFEYYIAGSIRKGSEVNKRILKASEVFASLSLWKISFVEWIVIL